MTTTAQDHVLAERLNALIGESHAPLGKLAVHVGMNRTTLFKWLRGKSPAPRSIAVLAGLADRLGVSVDWLLGRTDDRAVSGQTPAACPECARLRAELDELRGGARAYREDAKAPPPLLTMTELARQLGQRKGAP